MATPQPPLPVLLLGRDAFPAQFLEAHFAGCHREAAAPHYRLIVALPDAMAPATLPPAEAVVVLSTVMPDDAATERERQWIARRPDVRILRLPDLIGTGMTGRWRDTVTAIYRGFYIGASDADARVSVLHALDLGPAIEAYAAHSELAGHVYDLCDARTPQVRDVAEALSHRLSHKRYASMPLKRARRAALVTDIFTLGMAGATRRLKRDTQNRICNSTPFLQATGFEPINTLQYLTTHEYGPEDI